MLKSVSFLLALPLSFLALTLLLPYATARAEVRIVAGPTPIAGGEARAPHDLTVVNDKLAFALAIETPVPYGVARGAIIDVAPVHDGQIGPDRVTFADFIPNNWSGWPNSYRHVQVLEHGPRRVVIRIIRDWGKVTLTTVYTLASGSDHVVLRATLHNGGASTLSDLLSGFTLWPKGGFLFGVPGLKDAQQGATTGALADRVVAYDHDWSITLHAPYADHIANGARDLLRLHSLAPGASRSFEAWLQVGPRGDLSPVLGAEIERKHLPAGTLSGSVTGPHGESIDEPVVVIEKHGQPYAWSLGRQGRYTVTLPAGAYRVYATAEGRSQTPAMAVSISAAQNATLDFRDLAAPGRLRFSVVDARSGAPLDACIAILEGQRPLVGFLGRGKFFTELDRKGRVDLTLAPGRYRFAVTHGGAFLAPAREVALELGSGEDRQETIAIAPLFDPSARGWYGADLHHHADQAEAVTPPEDLARSELAAGLDLLFVSDHDSTVNHRALEAVARRRAIPFIPSVELSASWGHFNAYPLALGERLAIDTGTASVGELFAEARRLGAVVIQVNHPFIPYGYFTSVQAGVAPGGFDPSFDLIEINASASDDDMKVMHRLWEEWNHGRHYYLSAGTDTHDVWHEESGRVRVFAHPEGPLTATSFAEALKAGHGYVSYGPLIFPSILFGTSVAAGPDHPAAFAVDLQSVAGLKQVQLIGGGAVLDARQFADGPREANVRFSLPLERSGWFALVVEDVQGRRAYTDPVWTIPAQ